MPTYLLDRLLEVETLSMIHGKPAAGKSLIAIAMGLSIATGNDFFGLKTSQGPVFYIAAEGHDGLGRRIKAWELEHNNGQSTANAPFFTSTRAMQVLTDPLEANSAQRFAKSIEDLSNELSQLPKLCIIDTYGRSLGDGEENSNSDANKFFDRVDNELRKRFNCALMIVHHDTKHGNNYRGASAIEGAVDTSLGVEQTTDGEIIMSAEKQKEGAKGCWYYKIKSVALPNLYHRDNSPVTSATIIQGTSPKESKLESIQFRQQRITDYLNTQPIGERIGKSELLAGFKLAYPEDLSLNDETTTSLTKNYLKPLEQSGYVKCSQRDILLLKSIVSDDFDV